MHGDQDANRILVVDDDEQILLLMRMILERAGYAVDTAEDGERAVRAFNPRRHILLITDIVMPDKEGIETIRELRERKPDLPVIAISGGGRIGPQDYLSWVRRCGVRHTFAKPVKREDLLAAVAELIGAPVA